MDADAEDDAPQPVKKAKVTTTTVADADAPDSAPAPGDLPEKLFWGALQHPLPPVRRWFEEIIREKYGDRAEEVLDAPSTKELLEVTKTMEQLKLQEDAVWD